MAAGLSMTLEVSNMVKNPIKDMVCPINLMQG